MIRPVLIWNLEASCVPCNYSHFSRYFQVDRLPDRNLMLWSANGPNNSLGAGLLLLKSCHIERPVRAGGAAIEGQQATCCCWPLLAPIVAMRETYKAVIPTVGSL
jgi:hypothetical protein